MRTKMMKFPAAAMAAIVALAACDDSHPAAPEAPIAAERGPAAAMGGDLEGPFTGFGGAAFDLATAPNGNLLVAVTHSDADGIFSGNTIREVRPNGTVDVIEVPAAAGSPLNGIEPIGQRSFFATTGGQNLAVGAGLWRVSQGNARLVADIEAWTMGAWNPDRGFHENEVAAAGPHPPAWKDFRCEEFAAFSHGPQTNPYHLTALSGGEVLIGDAANNGLLRATTAGAIDWVAFMEPPLDANDEWMVLGYVDEDGAIVGIGGDADGPVECYVEPVPTSVAVGPDGAWYVGELTGTTPPNLLTGEASPEGLARVWRIDAGALNVVCPSDECVEVISGLNTVIDLEFGPNGLLYVVEFDRAGFFPASVLETPAGGSVQRCDVGTGTCEVLEGDDDFLLFPAAITFDRKDDLWLVENVFDPVVRRVDWR